MQLNPLTKAKYFLNYILIDESKLKNYELEFIHFQKL